MYVTGLSAQRVAIRSKWFTCSARHHNNPCFIYTRRPLKRGSRCSCLIIQALSSLQTEKMNAMMCLLETVSLPYHQFRSYYLDMDCCSWDGRPECYRKGAGA